MPLHCISDGIDIYAYKLDDFAWAEIRQRHKRDRHLRFPCCGAIAVPKVSSRGTRFFAHFRKDEKCTSAPESWLHLLAKHQVAVAAQSAGWDAKTEYPLRSGHVADVFVERAQESFIFEVQLQKQNDEHTAFRHSIYQAGAKKCVWLFKQPSFRSNREIPAFNIRYDADRFIVGIPPREMNSAVVKWSDELELSEFVTKALAGRLNWVPLIGGEVPIRLYGLNGTCPQCKHSDRLLSSVQLLVDGLDPSPIWFWDSPVQILEWLRGQFHSLRVGRFQERPIKRTGEIFLTNGCRHCGAEIPNWVVRKCAQQNPCAGTLFGDASITLDESLAATLKRWKQYPHWKIG
jgi:hypothetical protein